MLNLRTTFLGLALLAIAFAPAATAHKTVVTDDEAVKITWGLLDEPATTWTKTGLDLIVRDNATGNGIMGVHETLTATLKYGDDALELELSPQHGREAEGRYTSQPITLTRAGLYVLHVKGAINGTEVDMEIPAAHEYTGAEETFFPEPAFNPYAGGSADTAALEQQVADLQARLAALEGKATTQANTPTDTTTQDNVTPGFGALPLVAALGAVAVMLALRKRA